MQYYGQSGEDKLAWTLFPEGYKGVFLDIGAHDGMLRSNTYSFELAGWTGVCVEAHKHFFDLCKQNRPKSIVFHAAVANMDRANVPFYTTNMGSLSTLDKGMEDYFSVHFKECFHGFIETKVNAITIDTLLKQNNFSVVDFVSIDVEGSEMEVLHGFSIEKYSPRLLVVEAMGEAREQAVMDYFKEKNYFYATHIFDNFFFCRTKDDAEHIKSHKG